MQPLFPRSSNSAVWVALVLGGGAVIGVPTALMVFARMPYVTGAFEPVEQPVLFDHRHHVLDAGIDCLYCHYLADESPSAGVPPTELCMNCHGQIWNESPLLAPVRQSWESGEPLPWQRVYDVADFVYFHHAAHVKKGVGCSSCHGHVEEMARVYSVESLRMGFCLDCHRNPAPHLRDPALVTDIDWRPTDEKNPARLAQVDPPTNCSGCHR